MSDDRADEDRFRAGIAQVRGITRAAVEQLETLRGVDGVVVEFGAGDQLSVLFKIPKLTGSDASIFNVDTTGRLMLMAQYHRHPRVMAALEAIHRRVDGAPPPAWLDDKPTFPSGAWERCTYALVAGLEALAAGEDAPAAVRSAGDFEFARQAVGPVVRSKTGPRAQGAAVQPTSASPPLGRPAVVQGALSTTVAAESSAPATTGEAIDVDVEDVDGWASAGKDARVRMLVARWLRGRQSTFRKNLLRAYESRCCISDCGPPAVLEAAHIEDHAVASDNDTANGLLLRSDLHALFDEGLLRIDPARLVVVLDASLMETPYAVFQGRALRRAVGPAPSREKLEARWLRGPGSPLR